MSDPITPKPTPSVEPSSAAPADPVLGPRPGETPRSAGLGTSGPGSSGGSTPPRREPPTTIVDKAIETIKAYAQYVWADMRVLLVEIKAPFVKFATKQKNFLIGLVIFILLLLWLF
ncbi:hypothetical protein RHODGE_RHODGE_04688 [Rhodoplanes serenus]|uniref:Uncharacterized protein n=1 Tax=Rhodoplanes serenus TaxID=200615 RepID=A0A447D1Q2_9BRAD|nr:hypothetical protein [Rhodoplanes serenus]VCU11475.1 hypothetical protein RHODGE_RHODGE_04688 [Rhodoplanes serenus]